MMWLEHSHGVGEQPMDESGQLRAGKEGWRDESEEWVKRSDWEGIVKCTELRKRGEWREVQKEEWVKVERLKRENIWGGRESGRKELMKMEEVRWIPLQRLEHRHVGWHSRECWIRDVIHLTRTKPRSQLSFQVDIKFPWLNLKKAIISGVLLLPLILNYAGRLSGCYPLLCGGSVCCILNITIIVFFKCRLFCCGFYITIIVFL